MSDNRRKFAVDGPKVADGESPGDWRSGMHTREQLLSLAG
jgi:hypothetical protein